MDLAKTLIATSQKEGSSVRDSTLKVAINKQKISANDLRLPRPEEVRDEALRRGWTPA
jgi:hypothetical protein